LDLNEELIKNPASTFFVRVSGDSMVDAGIHDNDILIVDRSIEAREGKIVIAILDGELVVKRLRRIKGQLCLIPENPRYAPIMIKPDSDFIIWGIVTNVIHPV
jgi:DNA polymerase V